MKKITLAAALLSAVLIVSCGGGKNEKEATTNTPSTASATNTETRNESTEASKKTTNFLADREALQQAESQLKELPKFKGKEIKVFQDIHFYGDGRVMADLQDPDKPENIDNYTYKDGKWGEPQPVQISGSGDMSANVFSLGQIKFETVAAIYKQLEEKAKTVEGGEIDTHIYLTLWVPDQSTRWNSGIKGTREKWSGYFNADGSLKEFSKN